MAAHKRFVEIHDREDSVPASTVEVRVPIGRAELFGDLSVPREARAAVLFAHGSGSSRHSPRNRAVARALQAAGLTTLLLDLLTPDEDAEDTRTRRLRFDIDLLTGRLLGAAEWLASYDATRNLALGGFGASTGAAAALAVAASLPERVAAVVSRGGRPDLAGPVLPLVRAPTLLIVGGNDPLVLELNAAALERIGAPLKELRVVEGATHLFEEPGALEEVARLAAGWFTRHLRSSAAPPRAASGGRP